MIKFISKEILEDYRNKTCFLRVDLNFSPNEDHLRIESIIPTIKLLLDFNIKIIIGSHRGRFDKETPSLEPFVEIISSKVKEKVFFSDNYEIPDNTEEKIVLLENLRQEKQEEENNKEFAKKLADLADFYINDAFAVSHRENASIAQITRFLPSFGGLCLEKEVQNLSKALNNPRSPFTLILGGAKTADKIRVIKNLWSKLDHVLLGGGPANTFLLERGVDIGNSLAQRDARGLIETFAFTEKVKVPVDFKKEEDHIFDIGEETIKKYSEIISQSKMIIWNGPMGKFEDKKFREGTEKILEALIKNKEAEIIIGGGETISSLNQELSNNIFLSTGGGSMLEFLSGKELPGLKALNK
ncbi:MAG: phosphoglycerate kinase [Candidatus Paceibacterota bacterium]